MLQKTWKQFRHLNTRDEEQITKVKRLAALKAGKLLKLMLTKQMVAFDSADKATPDMLKDRSASIFFLH